jgi:multidrug efflux pump subunit AcrB
MRQIKGGLAAWSIKHPVGVSVIALAVVVLGFFALSRLAIDLLPQIIYPEIRVRILDTSVPATVMEDKVTRQLEEQLAITEDAISVQSNSSRGKSEVDLSFEFGKDMDIALRDASTRLDRAKRFLPDSIEPPIIFKLDPSQIPVMQIVVSSPLRESVELRSWVEDSFSNWFLNIPGVASTEVGGGVLREIQIIPDQKRLAGIGLNYKDIINSLQVSNSDDAIGRLEMPGNEITGRISGRFNSLEEIKRLPIAQNNNSIIYLGEVAEIVDASEDERILVRANDIPGIKLSVQKQPTANTTEVVTAVKERLRWLEEQAVVPADISTTVVADQSTYIFQSLKNASLAAISGALLAMSVVYIFLGNLRRTLIIGSAVPIAVMFTCILMGLGNLTLNIMTLGGLALGIGMLVDNTIVMLENIYRHQSTNKNISNAHESKEAASTAAKEVNSAIIASTSTNLSAVLPFLFIGGITGLVFKELIFTISAAIFASMIISLTLVPAYAAKVTTLDKNAFRRWIDKGINGLQNFYATKLAVLIKYYWVIICVFILAFILSIPVFFSGKQIFLPKMDDGRINVNISADVGISLEEMNEKVKILEELFNQQPETESVFTLVGGRIFGRTQSETPSKSSLTVQLVPLSEREVSSGQFIKRMNGLFAKQQLAGFQIRMSQRGIRGINFNRGDDDISLRLQGQDLDQLYTLSSEIVEKLKTLQGLRNVKHSAEEQQFEIAIKMDRERAAQLGLQLSELTQAAQIALQGIVISEYLEGDKSYDIRLRLARSIMTNPQDLESIILFPATQNAPVIYLGTVADITLLETPATIMRDNKTRIVEISATITDDLTMGEAIDQINELRNELSLPEGYVLYDGGSQQALAEQQSLTTVLMLLALFLVFVVMAIQYESLLNPMIIILSVPFSAIGVALAILLLKIPLSMPIWLGMIMLVGIVVNNAILLVEYIEIERQRLSNLSDAIIEAARLRVRPVLMTTLSTVVGMMPLAMALGDGAEMLQPLAITVVAGLTFSIFVSLLLVPMVYYFFHQFHNKEQSNQEFA